MVRFGSVWGWRAVVFLAIYSATVNSAALIPGSVTLTSFNTMGTARYLNSVCVIALQRRTAL